MPAVVNLAFRRLVQMDTNVPRQQIATDEVRRRARGAWPLHGFWRDATLHARHYTRSSVTNPPDHAIVLCPLQYQPVYTKRKGQHNLPLTLRRTMRLWPTPRATAPRHSKTLTVRTCGDLPTAALFACSVQGCQQMKAVDGMTVNPEFVEWLMGFPAGWTDRCMRYPSKTRVGKAHDTVADRSILQLSRYAALGFAAASHAMLHITTTLFANVIVRSLRARLSVYPSGASPPRPRTVPARNNEAASSPQQRRGT